MGLAGDAGFILQLGVSNRCALFSKGQVDSRSEATRREEMRTEQGLCAGRRAEAGGTDT
jgi:hypothetical protein